MSAVDTVKAAVLRSPIPDSGWGRQLTSTEIRDLRALGFRRLSRCIVLRYCGSPWVGRVYRPSPRGGFDATFIVVREVTP